DLVVERVQSVDLRIGDVPLPLPQDPDDHVFASPSAAGCGAAAGAPSVPPAIAAGPDDAGNSPFNFASSSSTSLLAPIRLSSAWMSSLGPAVTSSSAPEAISSSTAPARACICAVLSSARWTAMPTSPISSEMPANASLILVWASAAV